MGKAEIIIVGGGVLGLTNAYCLAKKGCKVAIIDQPTTFHQASWAGAGIIPPGTPLPASNPREWLRAKSSESFPVLSRELESLTGIYNGYKLCGGLECFSGEGLTRESLWKSEQIRFTRASTQEHPWLHHPSGPTYHFPDYAQIRNPWHLRALAKACEMKGVHFFPGTEVTGFDVGNNRLQGVCTKTGVMRADNFLICAGAWSGPFLQPSGIFASIHPVHGQMLLLQTRAPFQQIILSGKRYLVPRGDGNVLVGSTEENLGFHTCTTAEAKGALLAFACDLIPELKEARLIDHWAGLRPGCSSSWPIIGRSPKWDNLFFATGHFRTGLQTSPASALLIQQLLLNEPTEIPADAFINPTVELIPEPLFHS